MSRVLLSKLAEELETSSEGGATVVWSSSDKVRVMGVAEGRNEVGAGTPSWDNSPVFPALGLLAL